MCSGCWSMALGALCYLPQRVASWARMRAQARAEATPVGEMWMEAALAGGDGWFGWLQWRGKRRWAWAAHKRGWNCGPMCERAGAL